MQFRSFVALCAEDSIRELDPFTKLLREAEVDNNWLELRVEDDIFWFDITMCYLCAMQVHDSVNNLLEQGSVIAIVEPTNLVDQVKKVAVWLQWHYYDPIDSHMLA